MYKSPIEMIVSDIETKVENDMVKSVQSYGFNVDKEELTKALAYDREQYLQGFKDGYRAYENELLEMTLKTTINKLVDVIKSRE